MRRIHGCILVRGHTDVVRVGFVQMRCVCVVVLNHHVHPKEAVHIDSHRVPMCSHGSGAVSKKRPIVENHELWKD